MSDPLHRLHTDVAGDHGMANTGAVVRKSTIGCWWPHARTVEREVDATATDLAKEWDRKGGDDNDIRSTVDSTIDIHHSTTQWREDMERLRRREEAFWTGWLEEQERRHKEVESYLEIVREHIEKRNLTRNNGETVWRSPIVQEASIVGTDGTDGLDGGSVNHCQRREQSEILRLGVGNLGSLDKKHGEKENSQAYLFGIGIVGKDEGGVEIPDGNGNSGGTAYGDLMEMMGNLTLGEKDMTLMGEQGAEMTLPLERFRLKKGGGLTLPMVKIGHHGRKILRMDTHTWRPPWWGVYWRRTDTVRHVEIERVKRKPPWRLVVVK